MKGSPFVSTRNPCKLCAPLGASFVYLGIENCIPLLHGSQGCSTYIRRYGISHFREPIDIASSNFTESSAIFGGGENLKQAIHNIGSQYKPKAIGIASTCLSETMGENIPMYLSQYAAEYADETSKPILFHTSSASYQGTHMDGFYKALRSVTETLAGSEGDTAASDKPRINVLGSFISPEEIRELKDIFDSFGLSCTLLPDYSESLDGPSWEEYSKRPEGGTPLADIRAMNRAAETISFDRVSPVDLRAGTWLKNRFGIPCTDMALPVGIENCDLFYGTLARISGKPVPPKWAAARGRLIDAYIDGHKYCSGKRAIIYGDEEFVLSYTAFLSEIGVKPVIAATGARSADFVSRIQALLPASSERIHIADESDFESMLEVARDAEADLIIGNSKGYYLSRNLGIPLVRAGFPVHDRMGGQRLMHLGYRGTTTLFDSVCNAIMQSKQDEAGSGWTYI